MFFLFSGRTPEMSGKSYVLILSNFHWVFLLRWIVCLNSKWFRKAKTMIWLWFLLKLINANWIIFLLQRILIISSHWNGCCGGGDCCWLYMRGWMDIYIRCDRISDFIYTIELDARGETRPVDGLMQLGRKIMFTRKETSARHKVNLNK